jgi:hypothetical protein
MFEKIKKWYFDYRLNKAIKKYTKCVLCDNIISKWLEEMDKLSIKVEKIENGNVEFPFVMNDFFIDIINGNCISIDYKNKQEP